MKQSKGLEILKKHTNLVHKENTELTLFDQKLYNACLYFAKEQTRYDYDLGNESPETFNKRTFKMTTADLRQILGVEQVVAKRLIESGCRLLQTPYIFCEINEKQKIKKWSGFNLLAQFELEEMMVSNVARTFEFSFPEKIREQLCYPENFVEIDLKVINTLNSKYAYSLYELLKKHCRDVGFHFPIKLETLRRILGVPDGKLVQLCHFKQKCLEPAMKDIRSNVPELSGIEFKHTKEGRRVSGFIFWNTSVKKQMYENEDTKAVPGLMQLCKDFGFKENAVTTLRQKHSDEYLKANLEYSYLQVQTRRHTQKPIHSAAAYAQKAINENYAKFSELESPKVRRDARTDVEHKQADNSEMDLYRKVYNQNLEKECKKIWSRLDQGERQDIFEDITSNYPMINDFEVGEDGFLKDPLARSMFIDMTKSELPSDQTDEASFIQNLSGRTVKKEKGGRLSFV